MKNWIIIAAVALTVTACGTKEESTATSEEIKVSTEVGLTGEQIKNAGVQTGKPEMKMIGVTVYANGTIEVPPQNKTVIAAQFGGFVKALEVLDGQEVRKGQTLLKLEDPEMIQLQQDFLEVEGNMEFLKAELDRQQTLYDKDAGSARNYQQSKAQYNASKAQRNGLKVKLEMAGVNLESLKKGEIQREIAVRAPFNGVVTKVNVNVGAYADPKDHLLEIIDLKHSHAEVIVFEKDVQFLRIGQKVDLSFATDKRVVEASVFLIGKEIGKDRTVKVHCHLKQENKDLAPGSYFKAIIYTGEQEHLCVPSEAVVDMNGKSVVFVASGERDGKQYYRPEPVKVITVSGEVTAIEFERKNNPNDLQIAVSGAYDIMSAMMVNSEE